MKDKIKGIIIGLILGLSITITGVFATNGSVVKELWYNNIKITLDNKTINPTDTNGNYVEPFTIEGTTYLPVRAISNALGLYVDWDANTNTVKLSTQKSQEQTINQNANMVIYNENGIKATYLNYNYDEDGDLIINLLVENNSLQDTTLTSDNSYTSVNGFMVNGLFSQGISSGKKANARFTIYKSSLEKNMIKNVEELEIGFFYKINGSYVHTKALPVISKNNYDNKVSYTEQNSPQNKTTIEKDGFNEAKEYLIKNGYEQNLNGNTVYQLEKYLSNATITLMYKEKTDSILMRYDPDYVSGYDIANVIIEIYDNDSSADVSMVIAPDNVIKSYYPKISLNKIDFKKNMSIRFNDDEIPQSIRQSVDEYASKGVQSLLTNVNSILSSANIDVCDLGFVNYK
ncbi:MAG: copper amine oxidase N-terminal domain-containing protein [Ruminococcaceae bacterium]|nr:copper amine oxidase N-terminal domain-containing protein [Oscillospiraceae bacterium]